MAADEYDRIRPLFVFDPRFYGEEGLACDARLRFLHESLVDLDRSYRGVGGALTTAHASPTALLAAYADRGWDVVANAAPTGRYGLERDDRAAERCGVEFVADDGLVRDASDSRDGWSDAIETWFEADPHSFDPEAVSFEVDAAIDTDAETDADVEAAVDRIERSYGVDPEKHSVPTGGRREAVRRLDAFTDRIRSYLGSVSAPTDARTGTSGLSPYLRFGCLSVREPYRHVRDHAPDCRSTEAFVSRLYWNRHYTQKLADWPGWLETAVNPAMEGFRDQDRDPTRIAAWKRGETGYPMVDASMRCLEATGWLNFRMRAMCASVLCDLLAQPWRVGADWFYRHLIDADPAINYTQFQTQAGVVGVNTRRIYNPRKQVRENDPEGAFVREWVPELRDLPTEHLDRPERTPVHVQESCGVSVGDDYPYPIVEYEAARERAHERYDAVEPAAERALSEPEVRRRASLSRRGRSGSTGDRTNRETETTKPDQSSLSAFGASTRDGDE